MAKTLKELKKKIPNFKEFKKCLYFFTKISKSKTKSKKYPQIIDTGRLAEYYCLYLFGLKWGGKSNSKADAKSKKDGNVEIKQRELRKNISKRKSLPGMKIDLERKKVRFVYYVDLKQNLLPKIIYKIPRKFIKYGKPKENKRVDFKPAFEKGKVKTVYEDLSEE